MSNKKKADQETGIAAITETLGEIIANQRRESIFRGGSEFISYFSSLDSKHNLAWATYGYKSALSFDDFWYMYRRFGMAKGAIELPVDKCWQSYPWLSEDRDSHKETKWERSINNLLETKFFWQRLKGVDTRQRVGRYGGLLLIVKDSKKLNERLDKNGLTPDSLVRLIPLYESQMYISEYENDISNINYGQPISYQYRETLIGTNSRTQERSQIIHASRIIPWAEGSDTDNITTGIPALEAAFNDLQTMEKIIGAGGEGFWKNSRQSLNINYDQTLDTNKLAKMLGATGPEGIKDKMADVIKSFVTGFDESLLTQGADVKNLSISLPLPREYFEIAMWSAASSIQIPSTIWIGQQTGRLASEEDQSAWAQTQEARRNNFVRPMIRVTIDYLMNYNLFPKPASGEYFIEWDSLLEPSLKQKMELGKLMSETNKNAAGTGEPVPYTSRQIAETSGIEYQEDTDVFDDAEDDNG